MRKLGNNALFPIPPAFAAKLESPSHPAAASLGNNADFAPVLGDFPSQIDRKGLADLILPSMADGKAKNR